MTLDAAMDTLESDLNDGNPEAAIAWLEVLAVGGGLAEWGCLARQGQRRRACDLLCRLAAVAESESGAKRTLQVLEAADRCCSLPLTARYQAASLAAFCRSDTPFVHRLYRWATSTNHTGLMSGLGYLTRLAAEAEQNGRQAEPRQAEPK